MVKENGEKVLRSTLIVSRLFIDFHPFVFLYWYSNTLKQIIILHTKNDEINDPGNIGNNDSFFQTFLSALSSFIKMQFFTLWNSSPNKNGHYLKLQFIKKVQGQNFQFSIWLIFVFMENILLWLVVVKRSKYMIKWFLIQPFLEG